jgi:cytochrome c oxidase subunit 1
MILPSMGVISEVITAFSRQKIFGYTAIALSSMAIALLGFLVWGHHMFVSGQSIYAGLVFSILTFLVAIPSAIKVFNWTATLYKGSIHLKTPMIYALGFIGLFIVGGLTGIFLGTTAADVYFHDTYFVVAHFHFVMVGSTTMAYLGGLHFWWPKISGRMYNEKWGISSAVIIFIGFNLTFLAQFVLGYMGMPRRYASYPEEFEFWHQISTLGTAVLGFGYILPLFYLTASLFKGKIAGANPWLAKGLEWTTSSPPPPHNFAETPVVTEGAYNYPDDPDEIEKDREEVARAAS